MINKLNNLEEKKWLTLKGFGICVLIVVLFLLLPSLIGSIFYYYAHLSEVSSLVIGNTFLLLTLVILFFPTLKKQFKFLCNNFSDYLYLSLKAWGIGFIIMVIANIIINTFVFPEQIAENEALNRSIIASYPIISLIEMAFIGPFIEEMLFRFALRKAWGKNKYFPLVTALIFGFCHVLASFETSSDLIYLVYMIPYGALGYSFGYIYNKTDNIFSSTLVHTLHNFISVIVLLLFM